MSTNNSTNNFGGSLTLIQTQAASSVAALTFTSGISSAYSNYVLIADNVIDPSFAVSDNLLIQLSTNGGSTYISTGYVNGATLTSTVGLLASVFASATSVSSCALYMTNMTTGIGFITSFAETTVFDSPSTILNAVNSGVYTTNNITVNALQVVLESGSAFSGNFSLYGYNV